jgi:hypothetical protein
MDEYVSLLVPKRHLTRIYAFLGSLDEQPVALKDSTGSDGAGAAGWTRELIERQFRESPPFMKRFQKHLAEHPGQTFSTRDMAKALEAKKGWNSVAGALGAYGRRIKNRYKQTEFAFTSWWDYEKGEAYHTMPEEVAEIIRGL